MITLCHFYFLQRECVTMTSFARPAVIGSNLHSRPDDRPDDRASVYTARPSLQPVKKSNMFDSRDRWPDRLDRPIGETIASCKRFTRLSARRLARRLDRLNAIYLIVVFDAHTERVDEDRQ